MRSPTIGDLDGLITYSQALWKLGSNPELQNAFHKQVESIVAMFDPREIPACYSRTEGLQTQANRNTPLPPDIIPLFLFLQKTASASKPSLFRIFQNTDAQAATV